MRTYIALIHKDGDSAWGVSFPDVPGCFSAADREEDILPNAIEALGLHLDGQDLPEARDVTGIASEHGVAEDLRAGAFLMAVPHVTMAHKAVRANISLDKGVLDAIDAAARERGLTRSSFIAEAALNEITGRHKAA